MSFSYWGFLGSIRPRHKALGESLLASVVLGGLVLLIKVRGKRVKVTGSWKKA